MPHTHIYIHMHACTYTHTHTHTHTYKLQPHAIYIGLPVINSSSPSSVKVSSGGSISLSCIAADSSQVSFQWLKDGKRITDCGRFQTVVGFYHLMK